MVVAYKDGYNSCIAHREIQKLDDVSLHSACQLYNQILHKLSDLKLNGLLILSSWCYTNRITECLACRSIEGDTLASASRSNLTRYNQRSADG